MFVASFSLELHHNLSSRSGDTHKFISTVVYHIALNFRGSLISQIFNHSQNYLNKNFRHVNYSFLVQERQWTTSWAMLPNAQGMLDTVEVGIALLTAVSSSRRWCGQCVLDRACLYAMPILYYVAAHAYM